MDVVVRDLGVRRGRSREEQEAGRRVVESADAPRRATEEIAVGHGEVGIEHDDIGLETLTVCGVHGDGALAARLDAGDLGAVAELHPVLLRRGRHRLRHGVHAALGEVDAGHGVHVGDDGVDRQRVVGGESGVHRLEGEDALCARIAEELPHARCEFAEAADRDKPGEVGREQVERRVDIAVDEVGHLVSVELGDEVDVAAVPRGLLRSDDVADLLGHLIDIGVHVELGAVGIERAVERRDGCELEPVGHVLADAVEGVSDEIGHGEHGRAGVDVEGARSGLQFNATRAATGHVLALQHGDFAPCAGKTHRRGESAEACPDDDDAIGGPGHGAGH